MQVQLSKWQWIGGIAATAAISGYLALSYSDIGTLSHDPATIKPPSPDVSANYFQNKKGLWIFARNWVSSAPPRGVVFLIHGLAEHSGRPGYQRLAETFLGLGLHVFSLDHQGHGKSNGSRAHVEYYEDFLDDIEQLIRLTLQQDHLTGLPVFILGHSMGGALALGTVSFRKVPNLAGIIVSSAAINLHNDPNYSDALRQIAKYLAQLAPKLPTVPPLGPDAISRNKAACEAYANDPLNSHDKIKANLGYQLVRLSQDLDRQWSRIQAPMLILHGGKDKIVDVSAAHIIKNSEASKSDKTMEIYPEMLHEIYEDPEADLPFETITNWLDSHMPQDN